MSLVKELGLSYVMQRFAGCMFYDSEGNPCYVNSNIEWPRGKVAIGRVMGDTEAVTEERTTLPESFFKDLSVFQVPPLGWRMSANGTYMAHFHRQNKSYQRALNNKVLLRTVSPATSFLIDTDNVDENYFNRQDVTMMMVMKPLFMEFRKGLDKMKKGEVFSFCVNPNLAVIPARDSGQTLLFNTTPVGKVNKRGEVVVEVPQVQTFVQDSIK